MIISPSMILTGKVDFLAVVSDSLDIKDIHRAQWKDVQVLADIFWRHRRKEYLNILQSRRIWKNKHSKIKVCDVVITRDSDVNRTYWSMIVIERTFKCDVGLVRKVEVRMIRDGKPTLFTRPVHELVLLLN